MSENKKSNTDTERANISSVGFGTSIGLSLGVVFGIISDKLILGNERTDHDFAVDGLFWTNLDGCLFEIMTYEY